MLQIARLKTPPAYQVVYTQLQRLIIGGDLRPGDPLPPETELAQRFAVNRSTIREGVRQLESEGLVSREGRKRLVVSVPAHGDFTPRLSRALVMQEVTFRELWQVASLLEPVAAELAALEGDGSASRGAARRTWRRSPRMSGSCSSRLSRPSGRSSNRLRSAISMRTDRYWRL